MAMTEEREATAVTVPQAAMAGAAQRVPAAPSGLAGMVGTGDHKTIGRLYIATSLLLAAAGGVMGILVSAERLRPDANEIVGTDAFAQLFTLHSVTTVFLFLLPLWLGIAIAIVPLQIGATTVAFPRAAAASFWLYLTSSALVLAAYGMNGGAFGGDFQGVDLFLIGIGALLASQCLAAVCVLTTVLTLRTSGMSLERTPLFSWSMMIAGTVWLLSLPVLAGLVILLYLDHHYGDGNSGIFLGGAGGLYPQLRWVFQQPQLWTFAVPALGVCAEVVPVFTRTRQRRYGSVIALLAATGLLGLGAWTMAHLENQKLVEQALYVVMAFAVVVPLIGLAGGWGETILRRGIRLASPVWFAVTAVLVLVLGALAGATGAIDGLNLQFVSYEPTTWATGVEHAVLLGSLAAALGGLYYWAPKLIGRMLSEGIAKLAAGLLLIGAALVVLPDLVSGVLDQLQFANSEVRGGVSFLNTTALGGGLLVGLAFVVVVIDLLRSLAVSKSDGVPEDPWVGHTLEWSTASPPLAANFVEPTEVSSPAPLLDRQSSEESSEESTE